MSLISEKRNVFTTVGAYTSMQQQGDLPDLRDAFPSINNKRETIPFLLDLLKVVVGSDALIKVTGELFTDFVDESEPQLKAALKNQTIQGNAPDTIPADFRSSGSGYRIPVKDIDLFGKLKTNPDSNVGSLLYGTNDTFDKKAYEAISNEGTNVVYNNLAIRYDSTDDSFIVKSTSTTGSIGDWIGDFIDNTDLINKKEFVSDVLDVMYGTLTSNQNKTEEEIFRELQIKKLMEKAIEGDEELVVHNDELEALQRRSKELRDGVLVYDLGCGVFNVELLIEDLTSTVSRISGSTNAFEVGNEIAGTINDSFVEDTDVLNENSETIKDGFFQRIISAINLIIVKALVATPQVRIILSIISAFENNGISAIGDFREDIQNFKVFIKCVVREIMKMLNEFIFNIIIIALFALLRPVIQKIIREKINSYIGVIKSLISSRT